MTLKLRPGLGDHDSAIMVDSLIKPLVNKSVSRKVYQFHKGNLTDLNYELSKFKTKFLTNCEAKSVEDLWNSYHRDDVTTGEIHSVKNYKVPSASAMDHTWITHGLKKQLKKKRKLYKTRSENLETLATYKKVRSQIQRLDGSEYENTGAQELWLP